MSDLSDGNISLDLGVGVRYDYPPKDGPKTFISIDLETTGLEMDKHGIIQIGAWATGENEDHFKDYFVMDVNPHYPTPYEYRPVQISKKALEVNGFTHERIDAGVPLWSAMHQFNTWATKWQSNGPTICVGQNVAFDLAWLKKVYYRQGLDTGIFRRNVDCYTLSFLAFGMPMGLQKVANRLGIKCGSAHDGLSDAYIASLVFHRLTKFLAREYLSVQPPPNFSQGVQSIHLGGAQSTCVR